MEKGPTLWVRGSESERDPGAGLRERRCEGPELCQGQAEQERWLMSGTGDWGLGTGDCCRTAQSCTCDLKKVDGIVRMHRPRVERWLIRRRA
jgi:hypothetical protein